MAEFLADRRGVETHGVCRRESDTQHIQPFQKKIRLSFCDLTDKKSVTTLFKKVKPHRVVHLAAQSSASASWDKPYETVRTNILSELNLFEAAREGSIQARVLVAGSSEEYGYPESGEIPIRESAMLRPLNPYAVSKIAQDYLAYAYCRGIGLKTIRARAFNHTGPRQGATLAVSSFARQTALIEAKKQKPVIETGNLNIVRDYTDVRDVVRAYWLLLEKGTAGDVYNVASGKGRRLEDIIRFFYDESAVKFSVHRQSKRLRSSEPPVIIGNAIKLRKRTGWKPLVPFETTLKDILNYWRQPIAS